jgi:hypothetical protein
MREVVPVGWLVRRTSVAEPAVRHVRGKPVGNVRAGRRSGIKFTAVMI